MPLIEKPPAPLLSPSAVSATSFDRTSVHTSPDTPRGSANSLPSTPAGSAPGSLSGPPFSPPGLKKAGEQTGKKDAKRGKVPRRQQVQDPESERQVQENVEAILSKFKNTMGPSRLRHTS